jgi:hypothetical protein
MASAWIKHVAAFRKAHPGMDPKKVFGEAAKTFKKQGTKQSGGALSPVPGVFGPHNSASPETASGLQIKFSGGKKSKRRGRGSKCGAKKRSTKKRSAKRSTKKRSAKGGGFNGIETSHK